MTNFEYLVKDVGMSKAQLEGIMKLANVCGFKPMFEADEVMDFDDFDIGEFEDHIDAAHAQAEEEKRQRLDSVKGKSIAQIIKENPAEYDDGDKASGRTVDSENIEDLPAPIDLGEEGEKAFGLAYGSDEYDELTHLDGPVQMPDWSIKDAKTYDELKNQEEFDPTNREMTDPTSVMNGEQKLVVRIIKKLGSIVKEVSSDIKELMVNVAEATRNAEETADTDDSNITYGHEVGDQNEVGDTDEVIEQVEDLCKRVKISLASMPESQSVPLIKSLKTMITDLTKNYGSNPFTRTLENFMSDISLTAASPSNYRGGIASSRDRLKQMTNAALRRVKGL